MVKFLSFLILALLSISETYGDQQGFCASASRRIFRVGSINVENVLNPAQTRGEKLVRPPGYNQAVVNDKISRVAATLDAIAQNGGRPDVLVLIEIHDEDVAAQLARKLNYTHMKMTRSRDERGMDVAILWNDSELNAGATYIDELIFENPRFQIDPTRNVLLVEMNVDGQRFVQLANHWPSLMNPTDDRVAAALETRSVMAYQLERARTNGYEVTVVAGGDFNTVDSDVVNGRNPFTHYLLQPAPGQVGPIFTDAQLALSPEAAASMPPASYWFKGKQGGDGPGWNRLDRFAIATSPQSRIVPVPDGFKIHITDGDGSKLIPGQRFPVPNRYFFEWVDDPARPGTKILKSSGRSDHFMITQDFEVRPAANPLPGPRQ